MELALNDGARRIKMNDNPPTWAIRFMYWMLLWIVPGLLSVMGAFGGQLILSDRMNSPLWLEIALTFETFMPILYLVFAIWALKIWDREFRGSFKGQKRETSRKYSMMLLWVVPCILWASQIVIVYISWDP